MCALNNRPATYMKQNQRKLKEEIDESIMFEDFNTPLSILYTTIEKNSKDIDEISTINQHAKINI